MNSLTNIFSYRAFNTKKACDTQKETPIYQQQASDVFIRTTPKTTFVPKRIISLATGKTAYKEALAQMKEINKKRFEKFRSNSELPPSREVNEEEFKIINNVQYEEGEYTQLQQKLKEHKPISKEEEMFLNSIIEQMKPSDEDKTLYRLVHPYEGFEEQIKSGQYDFDILTSTNAEYDSFFDFWSTPEGKQIDKDKFEVSYPYLLKINVPKGTKMLDCNASCNGKYSRMQTEIILPPSSCKVNSVDKDLGVIELTLNSTKM